MIFATPKTELVKYNVLVFGDNGNLLDEICVMFILCNVYNVLNNNMLQQTYIPTVSLAR